MIPLYIISYIGMGAILFGFMANIISLEKEKPSNSVCICIILFWPLIILIVIGMCLGEIFKD